MNERIKELRNVLGNMSQEKFGLPLGVTKTAVSKMELGTYNVTDTMIKLICKEYNVNEDWLRTGEGEMFAENDFFYDLGQYATKMNSTDKAIIIELMKMPEDQKQNLIDFWKRVILRSEKYESESED